MSRRIEGTARRLITSFGYAQDRHYDPLYRLTSANYTGAYTSTFGYTYDSVGNRLTQTIDSVTTNYAYDNANRLTSVNGQTYSWDNNGNLLSDGVNTYTYDQANRLIATNGQTTNVTFAYNGVGDRLRQTVGGVTTNYTLDLNSGLTQVLADGTNSYLYGVGRIGQYDSAMQYFGADGLGSVRQIYNTAGIVRRETRYDPFGNVVATAGSATSVYGFTGEQTDATGLVYLRARYYDAGEGRFTTRDTWEGDFNRPLSLNRWNYVEAQPVNYVDPSGMFLCHGGEGNDELWEGFTTSLADGGWDKLQTGWNIAVKECKKNWALAGDAWDKGDYGRAALLALGTKTAAERFLKWNGENLRDWDILRDLDCPEEMRQEAGARIIGRGFEAANNGLITYDAARLVTSAVRKTLARGVERKVGSEIAERLPPRGTSASDSVADDLAKLADAACSFSGETLVLTEEGKERIDQLAKGEKVWAFDEEAGTNGWYEIAAALKHTDFILEYLTIEGERLTTTPEHPFFTKERGWVAAGALWHGAEIRKADGSFGAVENIEIVRRAQTMYNLTVSEAHTFFVGDAEWLVHNQCNSKLLAQRLRTPKGYQAHHVITCECYDVHPMLERAERVGWDVNGIDNGISLPQDLAESIRANVPRHRGYHISYSEYVWMRLDEIQALATRNKWSDGRIEIAVSSLADELKAALSQSGGGWRLP